MNYIILGIGLLLLQVILLVMGIDFMNDLIDRGIFKAEWGIMFGGLNVIALYHRSRFIT